MFASNTINRKYKKKNRNLIYYSSRDVKISFPTATHKSKNIIYTYNHNIYIYVHYTTVLDVNREL